jgi:glutaredoxin-related protein
MGSILYYSNYCDNSKKIIGYLSKSSVKDSLHYVCIDRRIQRNNSTYIILENNQELLLPNTVNAVPALMILNNDYKVLFGDDIINYLKPVEEVKVAQATNFNGEPSAFSMNDGMIGVHSDNFSFLDQGNDELSAKGDGGMRQLYNYAPINFQEKIETPEENYVPDKVNENSLKNYEDARNQIK